MKNILVTAAIAVGFLGVAAQAHGQSIPVGSKVLSVWDVEKTVINRVPQTVEVCYQKQVSGDKTGDMLKGAIIGGIIGNNVGDIKNGGTAGAIIGGMIGHNNSTATGGTQTVCQLETRYDEEQVNVYSHSVIKFEHNGRVYTATFKK
tara:strand:+ start:136 stop:576 length:441 start_codon:yes stop_codon:yes gene_type:complete